MSLYELIQMFESGSTCTYISEKLILIRLISNTCSAFDKVSTEATVYPAFFSFYRNSDLSEQFKKLFSLSLCGQLAEFSYPVKLREPKDVLNPIKQQVNPACVVMSFSYINQNKKQQHITITCISMSMNCIMGFLKDIIYTSHF